MAEEAKDEAKTIPAAINRVVIAVFAIYSRCRRSRCRRCRSRSTPTASTRRCSACPRSRAASPATRCSASSSTSTSGRCRAPAEIYVGLLAATILFIATNAGIIGVSRLVYSMGIHRQVPDRLRQLHPQVPHAVDRDPRLRRRSRASTLIPGQADVPGQHVRVRRDAVVHDRAPRGHPAAASRSPDSQRPVPRARATSRSRGHDAAAVRGRRRHRHRRSRSSSSRSLHLDVAVAGVGWLALGMRRLRRLPPPPGARPDLDAQGRDPAAGRRPRGRVRVGARRARRQALLPEARSPPRSSSRRAGGAGSTCSCTITVPASPPIDAAMPEQERGRAVDHRAGQACRAGGACPATGEKVRAGQAGRRIVEEAREHARAGDRDAAAARAPAARRCSARRSRPCSPSGRAA